MKSYLNRIDLPRGLRNNNPGNLVMTAIAWQGKIPAAQNTDKRFEQFRALAYGTRAMLLDVLSDIEKKKQNTVRKLITSYAPPHENNTLNYINVVSRAMGLAPDEIIPLNKEMLKRLVMAIVKHENGAHIPFTEQDFEEGFELLPLVKKKKLQKQALA